MWTARRTWLLVLALVGLAGAGTVAALAVEGAGGERRPPIRVIDLSVPSPTPSRPPLPSTVTSSAARPDVPPSPPTATSTRAGDPARLVRPAPVPAGDDDDDGDDGVRDDDDDAADGAGQDAGDDAGAEDEDGDDADGDD